MTEAELFSLATLSETEATLIEELLGTLSIIPVDSKIARIAAELRRDYGTKLIDASIAATALFTGSYLVTRNTKDFRGIPDLQLQEI